MSIKPMPSEDRLDAVVEAVTQLAEAIRLQTIGLHALADAIAAPMDDEQGNEGRPGDDVERYMDGTPVDP